MWTFSRLLIPMSVFGKDSHLSAEDIAAFILGELESEQEERVFEHLDQYPICVPRLAAPIKAARPKPRRVNRVEVQLAFAHLPELEEYR